MLIATRIDSALWKENYGNCQGCVLERGKHQGLIIIGAKNYDFHMIDICKIPLSPRNVILLSCLSITCRACVSFIDGKGHTRHFATKGCILGGLRLKQNVGSNTVVH